MPTLVVARYNEPLDWLLSAPKDWKVYVYNKGGQFLSSPSWRVVDTPNIGREAETFCRHNAIFGADDYTIYLQGNPFDHCADPFGQAQFLMRRGDRIGWLGPHYDTAWNVSPHTLADLGAVTVWRQLFPSASMPQRFSFPAGAQMVVCGYSVRTRLPPWWQHAFAVTSTEDWRVAHCFERFWPTIYGGLE